MKKVLLPVLLATVGLAGCVAVPYGGGGYGYGGPAVYAPPVVVQPAVSFGYYGGYRGGGHYHGRGRHYR